MNTKNPVCQLLEIAIIASLFLLQSGCNKDKNSNGGTSVFNVGLTSSDASRSNYEAVYIDIQKVSIHVSTDTSATSGWFDLDVNTGIYDLLEYGAGNDTIIALDPSLDVQTVSQIRLILGDNNSIVESGETYNLETPSAQTSGIKIQVHAQLEPGQAYKVLLNFDVNKSIVKTGNGKYKLTPVINATVVQL